MSGFSSFLMNAAQLGVARFRNDNTGNVTLVNMAGKRQGPSVCINPGLSSAEVNARITAAFGPMSAPTGGTVVFNAGVHNTYASSIQIPYNVSVLCEPGCVFKPPANAVYTQGYLFLVNTTDGLNWTVPYSNRRGAFFDGARLDNVDYFSTVTAKLMVLGAPHMVRNISGFFTHGLVHTTNNYLDGFTIDGWTCEGAVGTDYQIKLEFLGDGLRIRGGGCGSYANPDTVTNAIQLTACQGGTILGQIGGTIKLSACRAITVAASHIEGNDFVIVEDSDVTINDSFIWKRDTTLGPRIKLIGDGHRTCVLNNMQFIANMDHVISPGFDVQTAPNKNLIINNCRTIHSKQSNIYFSAQYGIRVCQVDGITPVPVFESYSYHLSYRSILRGYRVTDGYGRILCTRYTASIPAPQVNTSIVWRAATATYFYNMQIVFDQARKLGSTLAGGEQTLAITNGGGGALIPLGNNPPCFVRVYRGTTAGSYDKYVDLPQMQADFMFDDGVVINGFPWLSRTAGAMDVLQDVLALDIQPSHAVPSGAIRARVIHSTVPTAGTFVVGDSCEIEAPAAGAIASYKYTSTGWKAETTLAA